MTLSPLLLCLVRGFRLRSASWVSLSVVASGLLLLLPMSCLLLGVLISSLAGPTLQRNAAAFGAPYGLILLSSGQIAAAILASVAARALLKDHPLQQVMYGAGIRQIGARRAAILYGLWLQACLMLLLGPSAHIALVSLNVGPLLAPQVAVLGLLSTAASLFVAERYAFRCSLFISCSLACSPWLLSMSGLFVSAVQPVVPLGLDGDHLRLPVAVSIGILMLAGIGCVHGSRGIKYPQQSGDSGIVQALRLPRAFLCHWYTGAKAVQFLSNSEGRTAFASLFLYLSAGLAFTLLAPGSVNDLFGAIALPLSFAFVSFGISARPLVQGRGSVWVGHIGGATQLRVVRSTLVLGQSLAALSLAPFLLAWYQLGVSGADLVAFVLVIACGVTTGWCVSVLVNRPLRMVPFQVAGSAIGTLIIMMLSAASPPDQASGVWLAFGTLLIGFGIFIEQLQTRLQRLPYDF